MSFYLRVYRQRRKKILPKIFKKETQKPWMSYEEIEIIRELLLFLKPRNCLEWGAGYSTLFFPKYLGRRAEWASIEHEKTWAEKIKAVNKSKRVSIFHVEPNRFPWTDEHSDGAYADLKDYVNFPAGDKFDFILIDGRARAFCLEMAHKILADNGIVVLHDAEREYYHAPLNLYRNQMMLSSYNASENKLWIGSRDLDLNDVVDITKYKILWEKYKKLTAKSKRGH